MLRKASNNFERLSVRRNGQHVRTISRIVFEGIHLKTRSDYPAAFGFANYRGSIQAVYQDARGALYVEATGRALKGYPLTRISRGDR